MRSVGNDVWEKHALTDRAHPRLYMNKKAAFSVAALVCAALCTGFSQTHASSRLLEPLSYEELNAEVGGTGGGGGSGGGGSTPAPLPGCTYNYDNDGYCDFASNEIVSVFTSTYGPAYKNLYNSALWYCSKADAAANGGGCDITGTFAGAQSRTFTASFEISAPLGANSLIDSAIGVGYEQSYSQEVAVGSTRRIPGGYAIGFGVEAQGKTWSGGYMVNFKDYGDGPRESNLTYAFPVQTGVAAHSSTWTRTIYNRILAYWKSAVYYGG